MERKYFEWNPTIDGRWEKRWAFGEVHYLDRIRGLVKNTAGYIMTEEAAATMPHDELVAWLKMQPEIPLNNRGVIDYLVQRAKAVAFVAAVAA
jgi:hypothetical protein